MSCGCKKREPVVVTPLPKEELPKQLTKEEIDWFNNIDVIKPEEPKQEDNG